MCHQFLCECCEKVSWELCQEGNDFVLCPFFSKTPYKTERRCETCNGMGRAVEDLGYWLARHPSREVGMSDDDDDTMTEKFFIDSDDETDEGGKKAVAKASKAASPWGESPTVAGDEEDKENADPAQPKMDDNESDLVEEEASNETIDLSELKEWMEF